MSNSYNTRIVRDGDDYILELPDQILEDINWDVGDTLMWNVDESGKLTLRKVEHIDTGPLTGC